MDNVAKQYRKLSASGLRLVNTSQEDLDRQSEQVTGARIERLINAGFSKNEIFGVFWGFNEYDPKFPATGDYKKSAFGGITTVNPELIDKVLTNIIEDRKKSIYEIALKNAHQDIDSVIGLLDIFNMRTWHFKHSGIDLVAWHGDGIVIIETGTQRFPFQGKSKYSSIIATGSANFLQALGWFNFGIGSFDDINIFMNNLAVSYADLTSHQLLEFGLPQREDIELITQTHVPPKSVTPKFSETTQVGIFYRKHASAIAQKPKEISEQIINTLHLLENYELCDPKSKQKIEAKGLLDQIAAL